MGEVEVEGFSARYLLHMCLRYPLHVLCTQHGGSRLSVRWSAMTSATDPAGHTYYVSPDGDDDWSGRRPDPSGPDGPFRTFHRAMSTLTPGDTLAIRHGTYRQPLRCDMAGTADRPIRITNYADETAVLSGTEQVTGWEQDDDGVYTARVDVDDPDRLAVFVDGDQLTEARWPTNEGTRFRPTLATADDGSIDTIADDALPDADWTGATIWCGGGSEWIYWASEVTAFEPATHTLSIATDPDRGDYGGYVDSEFTEFYVPEAGNEYLLLGVPAALDAPGEWCYTPADRTLRVIPPSETDLRNATVEITRRDAVIDVGGGSHIRIDGLETVAGGIVSDDETTDVHFENIRARHVGHSYRDSDVPTIELRGTGNRICNCDFGYSSGSVLRLDGADHELINSHIHHGNYAARFGAGTLAISGTGHLISHNTISDAGRDLVTVFGMAETIVQHNDLSNAGWIASDLGMVYGHTYDFRNSVFRYNAVHDNRANNLQMGIYFDHLSQNLIIHNNAIWNVDDDPIRVNNPSFFVLLYNNSAFNTGSVGTFDHAGRDDLFGVHVRNNLFNEAIDLPDHVVVETNLIDDDDPGYIDPDAGDLRLTEDSPARHAGTPIPGVTDSDRPHLGAFQGEAPWPVGHDFDDPPTVARDPASVAHMNQLENAAFEAGTLDSWTVTGDVQLVEGNGWGTDPVTNTGTGHWVVRLGEGSASIAQELHELEADATYVFSGWIAAPNGAVELAVGDEVTRTVDAPGEEWFRFEIPFRTAEIGTEPTVSIGTPDDGGPLEATNLGVQQRFDG